MSPTLFQMYIDELIYKCTKRNIGSDNKLNMSIIVYADDIILSSPVDSQLQKLLDICDQYSIDWRIKFNALKSNIVEFGKQFFDYSTFTKGNKTIPKTDIFTYLGVTINNSLDLNNSAIKKFGNSLKSVLLYKIIFSFIN